jgi:peptidoglycan/LPS O-acetylase OafA/YrhL
MQMSSSQSSTKVSAPGAAEHHVRSLDGVRAIAIIGVLLTHAGVPLFEAGWLGVDLFFALSGFLITTLLLEEHARVGAVSYKDFLARRALRLMPAYLLYVAAMTYGIWGWSGSVRSPHGSWTPEGYTVALWTYAVNFAPMGGLWNGQEITVHLWSLAVEQQYYILWPIVIIALAPRPSRLLIAGLVIAAVELAAFVLWPGDGLFKTSMLFTRGFTLALASTCAIAAFHWREWLPRMQWHWLNAVGAAAIALAFALSTLKLWPHERILTVLLPFMSIAFVLWIARLWYGPSVPSLVSRLLLHPVMQYIGKVSYGVYLYHELVRVAVWHFGKPLMSAWSASAGYGVRLIAYLVLSIAVAGLSYEWIEKNFLRLRTLFRPGSAPGESAKRSAREAPTGS